jgi:hypothetical protein
MNPSYPFSFPSTPRTGGPNVFFTSRDRAKPEAAVRKQPWSKVRPARFTNDTVKFGHLERPLSKKQRGILSGLAQKAFKLNKVQGWTLDDWRRAQAIECCRYRISEAPGKMYKKLEAHFAALAGQVDRSLNAEARSSEDAQRHGGLMFLIAKELCRLPRLTQDDTEEPVKGTPRKTAWAWADTIAERKFGGPCRSIHASQLGTLHAVIKKEVGAEMRLARELNAGVRAAKKAAREAKKKRGARGDAEVAEKPVLKACRCGDPKPVSDDHQIQCPACGRLIEGEDFAKVLAKWNQGGTGA